MEGWIEREGLREIVVSSRNDSMIEVGGSISDGRPDCHGELEIDGRVYNEGYLTEGAGQEMILKSSIPADSLKLGSKP